jgi:hypothetical protein
MVTGPDGLSGPVVFDDALVVVPAKAGIQRRAPLHEPRRRAPASDVTTRKNSVIPAKAGIHFDFRGELEKRQWIPAFAGMTMSLD